MIKTRHVKWLLTIFCVVQGAINSFGQTAPIEKHRCAKLSTKVSHEVASKYAALPEARYTPAPNLETWSARTALEAYAGKATGRVQVQFMLLVDEEGVIQEAEAIQPKAKEQADALKAILLNTKTEGPSFIRNKAVICYVPCLIKIESGTVSIQ